MKVTRTSGPIANHGVQRLSAQQADAARGLSSEEAADRLEHWGKNELAEGKRTSALGRFAGQFKEPLSLLLIPAGVVSAALGEIPDAIGIGAVSLLNAGIGFAEETQAERSMDALRSLSVREARVLRDGQRKTIPASDLVPGDVIFLKQGDVVPADARLLEAHNVQTDESALTGESLPVQKDASVEISAGAPIHDRVDSVFSGTAVKNGTATAVVTATGPRTEIGDIAQKTREAAPPPTPLEKDMNRVARQFMKLGGAASVLVGAATGLSLGSPLIGLTTAISTLVAVVPESLPTVTTLTLTNGIKEAKDHNVLIRKLSSVETLGSTTVIATDKTGTLTTGEMVGRKIWASPEMERLAVLGTLLGSSAEKEGDGWLGSPTEVAMGKYIEALPDLAIKDVDPQHSSVTVQFSEGVAQKFQLTPEEFAAVQERIREDGAPGVVARLCELVRGRSADYPFSSERKLHSTAVPGAVIGEEGYVSFTTGALDRLLPLTSVPAEQAEEIRRQNDELARQGFRVIALAHKRVPQPGETAEMEGDLTFSGLMAIQDPLRPGVRESVAELNGAGIRVMVITGDQILTARAIAEEAGILEPDKHEFLLSDELLEGIDPGSAEGRKVLEGYLKQAEAADELVMSGRWIDLFQDPADPKSPAPFSHDAFKSLIGKTRVAYRVAPRHKFQIIRSLQELGETVAMTGDGVNDAPAIKSADIGIAMGIRGTDATKEAAHMILTDDSFNSIANGVKVGRLIHTNIRKCVNYTVSSNLSEIAAVGLAAGAALALGQALPPILSPLQILWINLVTDSLPSLGLGKERPEKELMREKPRAQGEGLLPRRKLAELATIGGFMGLAAAGLYLLGPLAGVPMEAARTMAFNFMGLSQCVNALNARKEGDGSVFEGLTSNKLLLGSLVGTAALQVALPYIPGLGDVLKVVPLSLPQWALVGGLSAAVLPVGQGAKRLFSRPAPGGRPLT